MKNAILIIISLLMSLQIHAQNYFTRTGVTQFEASEKAFEPVEAINNSTTAILDTETGRIAAQVFIAGFQFRNSLMQEHFNENYMDSHKYPKATFQGSLTDFSIKKLQNNKGLFELDGTLTIKGVEKKIQIPVSVKEQNNRIYLSGVFSVHPKDYGIKIPSIVRDKIAKDIQISIEYELIEKK